VVHGVGHLAAHGVERVVRRARHEQAVTPRGDARRDRRDLRRRLAAAEDHFRKPLTHVTVRVHAGEAQIVEGRRAHGVLYAPRRVGRRRRAGPNLFKKCL
jgi:hypothetical protein